MVKTHGSTHRAFKNFIKPKENIMEWIFWFTDTFSFRNPGHALWFLTTFPLVLSLIIICIVIKRNGALPIMAGAFLTTSGRAAIQVFWIRTPSTTYSVDCIWYNGLLALLMLVTFFWVNKKNGISLREFL